jgi:hypothetical protein
MTIIFNPDQPDCSVWREITVKGTNRINPENGKPIITLSQSVLGKPRLRHPETNKALLMTGDLKVSRPKNSTGFYTWKLFFKGQWFDVPSEAEFQRWTFDSVCETPDGSIVEPDAPESWLSLMALV